MTRVPRRPEDGPPRGHAPIGLFYLATGRARGLAYFGRDSAAYLAALAPLLAVVLVLSGLFAVSGQPRLAATVFLVALGDLLAPPVIAEALCRWWDCQPRWARYATVLTWSKWLMGLVLTALVLIASTALPFGVSSTAAGSAAILLLAIYNFWFHYFLARHALGVSRGRAVVAMLAVVVGTGALLQAPIYLATASGLERPIILPGSP